MFLRNCKSAIYLRFLIACVICAAAGQVLQTLLCGKWISGVTSLDKLLYVLHSGMSSDQIKVYDKDSYRLKRKLTVRGLISAGDIAACGHNRCAYVSDGESDRVHKLALPAGADVRSWPVNDKPFGLSVTDSHTVLVTCGDVILSKIKEFGTDGQLFRQLQLPGDVMSPLHTVKLSSKQFMVCHGQSRHRVCLLSCDGQLVESSYGSPGSGSQQMNEPAHLAVDRNGYVFVADYNNSRVLLLSPSLTYIREVVSRNKLVGWPVRLCLDEARSRLYVAVNVCGVGGHVLVLSI